MPDSPLWDCGWQAERPTAFNIAETKRGARFPSRPDFFALRRRLHLLGSVRSSVGSSVGSAFNSSSAFSGSSASSGGSVGRGSSGVGGSSRSVSSGVGGGVGGDSSGVFSLFTAGRESESGAGSGSSENDLAHECIP